MRFLMIFSLLLLSCAQLPKISLPDPCRVSAIQKQCRDTFAAANLRMLHSIEAQIPGSGTRFMTGLTLLCPEKEQFRSVMMSIEGLVIFDGVYDKGEISIARGIPPFDSPNFAKGLLYDVHLMLMQPDREGMETGQTEGGIEVCRYKTGEGMTADVEIHPDGTRFIRQYVRNRLRRTVRLLPGSNPAISEETDLVFHGAVGYSLHLKLLEYEEINHEDFQEMMKSGK